MLRFFQPEKTNDNHYTLLINDLPREGGDADKPGLFDATHYFNPRPPRGGRQQRRSVLYTSGHFNPRPPRGGRLYCTAYAAVFLAISIHAPREGGDK